MQKVKQIGKRLIRYVLERQVLELRQKHDFKLVVVVGSVGKTSTKLAIANILKDSKRVRFQEGNYNDHLTVPLIFFGQKNPNVFNIFAWLKIFVSNQRQINEDYPYDVVVAELGTDGPGQIEQFAYLKPDIAVITAVSPEHMEFFGSMDDVAKEELSVAKFSDVVVINVDDVAKKYLKDVKDYMSYGLEKADYLGKISPSKSGQKLSVKTKGLNIESEIKLLGKQGAKVALASLVVGDWLGVSKMDLEHGLEDLTAFNGRMKLFAGVKDSLIIDDTYNASPNAVVAGLEVLYAMRSKHKIAILGSMNELGEFSELAHTQVGDFCDPKQLEFVVTIGEPAKKYIASTAEKKGCKVFSFDSPYEAGEFVKNNMKKASVIFAKGSQNRVFAEESLKCLLKNPSDKKELVRQTEYWLAIKQKQFGRRA